MRRIPWLAVAILAGLLVATLPLASAEPAPLQLGVAGAYLPLVYQAPVPTVTPSAATPTLPPDGISFAVDELDSEYFVGDDISVVGTLLDAFGDGIANIAVTVRYTLDGADAGVWCTAITSAIGDWECPDKSAPASWIGKRIRITATATVQGRVLADAVEFAVVLDDAFPGPTLTPTRNAAVCAAEYPTVCIPPPPPDLDCGDIPYRRFTVLPPDRHNFDTEHDGVGCETP
jgi:hypothetical protein